MDPENIAQDVEHEVEEHEGTVEHEAEEHEGIVEKVEEAIKEHL
jgi:hypothetical protein